MTKIKDEFVSSAPNKYLQPFAYKQWEAIGNVFELRDEKTLKPKGNPFVEFVHRFSKNFGGLVGFFILILLIALALIIPFTSQDPKTTDISNAYANMFSKGHIFGTDDLGRDVWARLWTGLRFSLGIAVMATLIDVFIGLTIGVLMGYFEKFDIVMQFIIKVISNIPTIIIMIIAMVAIKPSFWIMVMALCLTGWIGMSQQIRAQVKRAKNYEWVTASRVLGTPAWKIVLNFIPVTVPILITQLVFTIPGAILAEAGLAFVGLSIPNEATLGNLLTDGSTMITLFPRYTLIPAFLLISLTTSVQLIGNATQDALRRQR
ncbi:ABC transporter permease [Mycoplasma marinum]|uniref:Peptide ABC transporter permease n=1 Tax=Mycoplasma marinum TaxID=1937190 RepID=A0A4R0XS75_9MOLU|nr:ABC transporter permease [Mycoplasma marinum]TCG11728.1 peptide ABC transporter permease [Mycoplasma marinum]